MVLPSHVCVFTGAHYHNVISGPQASNSSARTRRMRDLDSESIEKIQSMSAPSDMERGERKRQYAALGRAVKSSCNPALIQKLKICSDSERSLGFTWNLFG